MSEKSWALECDVILQERIKQRNRNIGKKRPLSHQEIEEIKRRKQANVEAKLRMKQAQEPFKDKDTTQKSLELG